MFEKLSQVASSGKHLDQVKMHVNKNLWSINMSISLLKVKILFTIYQKYLLEIDTTLQK